MFTKGQKMLMEFTYDFAVNGGAIGTVPLKEVAGNKLDTNARILGYYAIVDEALTSGGTPTITFGPSSDTDGYSVDCFAVLNSASKATSTGLIDGALLWDTANDTPVIYKPITEANDVIMVVGAAALTGGKLRFFLEVMF